MLFPTGEHLYSPTHVDFRDTARAHVGALDSKPDKNNRKRIILSSPHGLTKAQVLDIIKKKYPELECRLTTRPISEFSSDRINIDFDRVKEITGMGKEDFRMPEEVCLHKAVLIIPQPNTFSDHFRLYRSPA